MSEVLADWYPWVKAFHVMAVIAWMAGLFYLPRLFVYHVEGLDRRGVAAGSEMDLLFQRQERLLLKAIMTPAMLATWAFGLLLVMTPQAGVDAGAPWVWAKAAGVLAMSGFHGWLSARRRAFAAGTNRLDGRRYRLMNEVPTVLMVVIVIAVFVRF
mgnify:CR=1 FL=1